jgi:hypothetical protein
MGRLPNALVVASVALTALAHPAFAERPRTLVNLVELDPTTVPSIVNSHVIYMNPCMPSGCSVSQGPTDSRTHHSDIIRVGQATLTAYPYGQSSWNSVMTCMRATFAPFNVTITDVNPGNVDHFEIMVAGSPSQVGLPNGVGGIADSPCGAGPGLCSPYYPNALVFDFANVWGNDPNEICATAAQEIGHSFTLDHVIDASDPMTYNNFSGMRTFHDGRQCGSDCVGGTSPYGLPCSGAGTQLHICMPTNANTQDEIKIIQGIFGVAGAQAPSLTLVTPKQGSAQAPGFSIEATCTSGDGIQEVDMSIDGVLKASLQAAPFKFTAPADLTNGTHHVQVLCATKKLATASATADVLIGQHCATSTDCPMSYICYQTVCIANGDVPGGLGAACTTNAMCQAGACASDGMTQVCVVPCDPMNDHCPDGFGCLMAGTGGVCWPGAAHGDSGGCCDSGGGDARGSILLGLLFGALLITRRRRPTLVR